MRATAILVNMVQMVIVLAIFVLQGLTFSGWTIFGLFLILMIAGFNLLILLFHGLSEQHIIKPEKPPIVKRQDLRVAYGIGPKPDLIIGQQSFSILDIAESGIRIHIDRHETIKKRVKGRVDLLCGETMYVRASLVRRQADEAALQFRNPLGYSVLLAEKQAVDKKAA